MNKYLLLAALAWTALFPQGCSKQVAPDPPRSRSRLTLELFEALQAGDHKTALAKVERLRSIDKTNLFLAQLQNIETDNVVIKEAGEALKKYEPQKAVKILDKAIKLHGQRDSLLDAKKQIISLMELNSCIKELKNPSNALSMAKAAVTLKKMGESDKSLKVFDGFIKDSIERAYTLEKSENERAFFSLASDIKACSENGNWAAPYMLAELALESPSNPLVEEYTAFLRKQGKSPLFTKLIIE